MSSIVLAITGASALQLGERSIQVLLENCRSVDLILSKGAYEVAKARETLIFQLIQKLKLNIGDLSLESNQVN